MKKSSLIFGSIGTALLLFLIACQESPTDSESTPKRSVVTGFVRDSLNNPIAGAIVVDNGSLGAADTTDAGGAYVLEFHLTSQYNTTITVNAVGYYSDTAQVSIDAGGTVTRNFQLRRNYSQNIISVKPAANIVFLSATTKTIAIRGTGMTDFAVLKFQITDSSGNPTINTKVKFSLLSGPGGGEYISPDSTVTDNAGIVTANVWSGTKAGIMQVVAQTADEKVKAQPATIVITGGYPDGDHFSISSTQYNIAGIRWDNLTTSVMVVLGDRYGNPPVKSPVRFTTTAGTITGSVETNDLGIATATLISGDPRPVNGRVFVTASVVGDSAYRRSDSLISRTIMLVFSGTTQIQVPSTPVIVPDSGTVSFTYKVSDEYGNPIVANSTINVRLTDPYGNNFSSVQLLGDVNVTTKDTYDTASTNYRVTIAKLNRSAAGGPARVIIEVKSPQYGNGDATKEFGAYVQSTSASGGGASFGRQPYSIELTSVERTELRVAEGGTDPESYTRLSFTVRDSLGNRIMNFANSGIPRVYVMFALAGGGLGGGEQLVPAVDSLTDEGTVSTIFRAGNRSGIVRVVATILGVSRPPAYAELVISGGYPDANRIVATLDKVNYPGFIRQTGEVGKVLGKVSVQMSDQFNNPPRPGTKVYFTTTGGSIEPVATLSSIGTASVNLFDGGATPMDGGRMGEGHVTLTTYGRDETVIQKTIPFIFSGAPVISVAGVSNDSIVLYSGGFLTLNYKVMDINRNPLAAGNNVSVTVTGSAANYITVTGDRSFTTVDTRDTNYTNYQIVLKGGDIPVTGTFDVLISVDGPNGSTTKRLFGRLYSAGTIAPPSEEAKQPAQIAFVSISTSDIYVARTGSTESAVITYEVRDSLGAAILPSQQIIVRFELSFEGSHYNTAGTAPQLLPDSVAVDNSGRVRVVVYSGTRSGVVQVISKITLPDGREVISQPVRVQVHAGFADQRHFTITAEKRNFPGLYKAFVTNTITVQVGDRYSNPVLQGTAVRFETWHGIIGTGQSGTSVGTTNIDGFVSQTLWSAKPIPLGDDALPQGPGWSYVKAITEGENGTVVHDSVIILWTGGPVIRKTAGANTFTIPDAGDAGEIWEFTVTDSLGHPLSAETTIEVVAEYAKINTNANVTLNDTFATGDGITNFSVTLEDADPNDTDPLPRPSVLKVIVNHPVYGKYTLTLATGVVN